MTQEKLHPVDISVMFNDGTIHTFENAMYYDTFGDGLTASSITVMEIAA